MNKLMLMAAAVLLGVLVSVTFGQSPVVIQERVGAPGIVVSHEYPLVTLQPTYQQASAVRVGPPVRNAVYQPFPGPFAEELPEPVQAMSAYRPGPDVSRRGLSVHGHGLGPMHGRNQDCGDPGCHDDKCCRCKPVYLQCCWGDGTFILRCNDTGHATYRRQGCVCDAELVKFDQDPVYVYYREKTSQIMWAFARDNAWVKRSIWIHCKDNPLAGDWDYFCSAESKKSWCP